MEEKASQVANVQIAGSPTLPLVVGVKRGTTAVIIGIGIWIGGLIFSIAVAAMIEGMNPDWQSLSPPDCYIGAQTVVQAMFLSYLPFSVIGGCFVVPGILTMLRDKD